MFGFLRSLLAGGRVGGPAAVAAVAEFQRFERELQQDFFALAARSGKPRGLRWMSCEWPQELLIVVDQESQLISAFSSVNIGFEAIAGGDMEDVPAVSTIRDGSAVFHYRDGGWGSAGRVIFNMPPARAAEHLIAEAEVLFLRAADQSSAPRRGPS